MKEKSQEIIVSKHDFPTDGTFTNPNIEGNIHLFILEIGWWGITVGFLINYLSIYIVHLRASSLLVGALTYGPMLVATFGQLPAARLLRRHGHLRRRMISSVFATRIIYLFVALLPLIISTRLGEVSVFLIILQAIPGTFAGIAILTILADAVPANRMAEVLGKRWAAYGLTVTISNLLAGQILSRLPFPINYQIIFSLGFVASMLGLWRLGKLKISDTVPESGYNENFLMVLKRTINFTPFLRFVLASFVFNLTLGMLAPLIPLFYVHHLKASDLQISILVTVGSATMMVGSMLMPNLSYRIKHERLLAIGITGHALYPLLYSFSPSVWWTIPFCIWANFFGAAINASLFADLVNITPSNERAEFISVYTMVNNSAVFIGSLSAGILGEFSIDIVQGLRLAACVNIIAAIMFWIKLTQKTKV